MTSQTMTSKISSMLSMETSASPRADELLAGADAIGARLCRDAIWAGDRCNWLSPAMEPDGGMWRIVHKTLGPDLYNGTAGIALFLARLAQVTDDRLQKMTAVGAMRHALAQRTAFHPAARISFYSGWSGLAYAALATGAVLNEPIFLDEGYFLAESLANLTLAEPGLDVLGGVAGAIPFLVLAADRFPDAGLDDLAQRCGEVLLETARRTPAGWSWNTMGTPAAHHRRDLLGFSHGAGGIAWALAELGQFSDDGRFGEAAQQALAYERRWYDAESKNWPDFRALNEPKATPNTQPGHMVAWCHGAPGIALSRLRLWELTGDPTCRQEATTALETTLAVTQGMTGSPGTNMSLCHGQSGNAEVLLYGADVLNKPCYRTAALGIAAAALEQYHKTFAPYPSGVMSAGETPGLFLGIAGTGYFFLRVRDSQNTPPILIVNASNLEKNRNHQ